VITRLRYHWHRIRANALNAEARELSALMRSHPDPYVRSMAAKDLLEVGALSNQHEGKRDHYRKLLDS
jgi:hypothetical protein